MPFVNSDEKLPIHGSLHIIKNGMLSKLKHAEGLWEIFPRILMVQWHGAQCCWYISWYLTHRGWIGREETRTIDIIVSVDWGRHEQETLSDLWHVTLKSWDQSLSPFFLERKSWHFTRMSHGLLSSCHWLGDTG